ncbi:hypothetical protein [Micromonospora chalcea]|uniref:hypothetical protein n=1 Tax=Micromonospora chalcea TaxID=1874 RepID=UPI00380BD616
MQACGDDAVARQPKVADELTIVFGGVVRDRGGHPHRRGHHPLAAVWARGEAHLAALTIRADGTQPNVVGLYGRHGYAKWITGSAGHHAVATPFSHLMSVADACPVRDRYDDTLWSTASDLRAIPAKVIANFAGQCAGWWTR